MELSPTLVSVSYLWFAGAPGWGGVPHLRRKREATATGAQLGCGAERERLREWQRPVSRTQVDKALQEWEVWRVLTSQNKGHGYYTACTVCRWGLHWVNSVCLWVCVRVCVRTGVCAHAWVCAFLYRTVDKRWLPLSVQAVEEKLKDMCVEVEDLVRDTWSADTVTQVCTDFNQQVTNTHIDTSHKFTS